MRVTPICGWFVVPLYVQATPTKTIQPLFRLPLEDVDLFRVKLFPRRLRAYSVFESFEDNAARE